MIPCTLWVKNIKPFSIRIGEGQVGVVIPRTVCLVDEQGQSGDYIRVIPDYFVFEGGAWKNESPNPFSSSVHVRDVYAITDKEASENHEK